MLKIITGLFEAIALMVCAYLGYRWTQDPDGNYESWLFLVGLVFLVLEVFRRYEIHFIKRERKELSTGDLARHREELRQQFQEEIYKCRSQNLRRDVVIRHLKRIDSYPDTDKNEKGISPWFRVGLVDTYHKGILVGLQWGKLAIGPDGYRYRNFKNGEEGDIKVLMVGRIPFDFIEAVNFDGDEYYNYPHIYCHFANKGEPYEKIVFCEEVDIGNGHTWYKEIVDLKSVKENSIGFSVEHFA